MTSDEIPVVTAVTSEERGGEAPRFSIVSSRGLMVRRVNLLRDLKIRGPEAGITIVCAPDGMGKTALLLEYVAEVRNDPERGSARLLDASALDEEELYTTLRRLPESLSGTLRPLVAVDNMPELGEEGLAALPELLRDLRRAGFEFIVSCKPTSQGLLRTLGDSYKIGAQALIVRPREYSDWTQAFSIDRSLDVYALTQGVPGLVAALQTVDGTNAAAAQLQSEVASFYQAILGDLRHGHASLYRLACLLLLVGEGEFSAFAKQGMRLRDETIARLTREYPVFGIDAEHRSFSCMMPETPEMVALRSRIARERPAFARSALQVLMAEGKIDGAVCLAEMTENLEHAQELVETWPLELALSGNARFVNRTVSKLDGEAAACVSAGTLLAVYASALVSGDYRTARTMASELHRQAHELRQELSAETIETAYALAQVWKSCAGVALPEMTLADAGRSANAAAQKLRRHREVVDELFDGSGLFSGALSGEYPERLDAERIDLPSVLLACDRLLNAALHGDIGDAFACDKRLQVLSRRLRERGMEPAAELARMTGAMCRLMSGLPLVDERGFVDCGTAAVRVSDLPMQLFCLLGEGWQAMDEGKVVNARFRAQQVLRLADESQRFLRSWGMLLERSSYIVSTAKYTLCEEADLADLSQERVTAAEAWSTALLLSAAGYVSELSAWYSLHKAVMLDDRFRPMASQAMRAVGDRADAIRAMLPEPYANACDFGALTTHVLDSSILLENARGLAATTGQVEIKLFGGFRIERNGHLLTETLWRRKRLCSLASRLVLAHGSFVDRRILTEEMWPKTEYVKARDNLYTQISGLRTALGQGEMGPQYVLTQGEGIAFNTEYIASDVAQFDALARDVLLKRTGTSGRQIIESCLKLEELYVGPLYVAELGDPTFHIRQRKLYVAKFVDCMLRGVETALALEDMPSASWLIDAAQRQAPYREDVMRQAMRIYDRCGRRREIVEMYNAHLYYLKQVVHAEPENETRLAYESIMGRNHLAMVI